MTNEAAAVHPTVTPDDDAAGSGRTPSRAGVRLVLAYVPALVLAALVLTSLVRTGVSGSDITRYVIYWVVAVVLPGKVVARALIGVRRTVIEDLALSAITGVSLEILAWVVGVVTGLGSIVRFWWVVVLLAGVAVPALRRQVLDRVPDRMRVGQATGLAVVVALILMQLDLTGFRFAPVPPHASGIFDDLWWHLSLVQEMMKYEPPQTPQVAGVPFHYHYFADVQMASGARLSGVPPEVILFRLWPVAAVLLCVSLGFTLGRTLTRSVSGGVLSTGLMYAVPATAYIWPNIGTFAPSMFQYTSPSQILAESGIVVSALAIIELLRAGPSPRLAVWSAIVVVGSAGDKSTIVPIVAAGAVVALVRAAATRSWSAVRLLGAITAVLAVLGVVILNYAAGTEGGKIVLFGTLRVIPSFTDLVPTSQLRGLNNGLVLDSIDSPRRLAIAVLAAAVLLGIHGYRLAGISGLFRRHLRADLAVWFLVGAVLAGYGASLSFDQIGLSQVYFASTAAPLGAALTVRVLHDSVTRSAGNKRLVLLTGAVLGGGTALIVKKAVDIRENYGGFHDLERMLLPPTVVAVVAALSWLVWRLVRHGRPSDVAWAVAFAAVLGLAIPNLVQTTWDNAHSWVRPVHYRDYGVGEQLPSGDLDAMIWLRSHSGANDVVMTNAHCVPVTAQAHPICAARAFWVSGLSGRRVVLEGWAYTDKAQCLQGVGGRTYSAQLSPYKKRYRLNEAVFDKGDVSALDTMRADYKVRWIVAVHSAGATPTLPADTARVRYDNGDVTIYEVTGR